MKKSTLILIPVALMLALMAIAMAYPPPLFYSRWDTATDTNLVNGNTLTNVLGTSIAPNSGPIPLSDMDKNVVTNTMSNINFDNGNITSDGIGDITAQQINANLNSIFLFNPIPFGLVRYAVTNFDTRTMTNQSTGGIFANLFTGAFSGSGSALTGLSSNNLSGQINPSQIFPPVSSGGGGTFSLQNSPSTGTPLVGNGSLSQGYFVYPFTLTNVLIQGDVWHNPSNCVVQITAKIKLAGGGNALVVNTNSGVGWDLDNASLLANTNYVYIEAWPGEGIMVTNETASASTIIVNWARP